MLGTPGKRVFWFELLFLSWLCMGLELSGGASASLAPTEMEMEEDMMIRGFLEAQNEARAEVGEAALTWDPKVAEYAQWWAEQRRQFGGCSMEHSPSCPYGENIFWGSGKEWSPSEAALAWVAEKGHYHYWLNACDPFQECGHYTQVVWNSTRRIGCARITCAPQQVFMTCNYDPPGNYVGERPY